MAGMLANGGVSKVLTHLQLNVLHFPTSFDFVLRMYLSVLEWPRSPIPLKYIGRTRGSRGNLDCLFMISIIQLHTTTLVGACLYYAKKKWKDATLHGRTKRDTYDLRACTSLVFCLLPAIRLDLLDGQRMPLSLQHLAFHSPMLR